MTLPIELTRGGAGNDDKGRGDVATLRHVVASYSSSRNNLY